MKARETAGLSFCSVRRVSAPKIIPREVILPGQIEHPVSKAVEQRSA
jgi:hypothetical protein